MDWKQSKIVKTGLTRTILKTENIEWGSFLILNLIEKEEFKMWKGLTIFYIFFVLTKTNKN